MTLDECGDLFDDDLDAIASSLNEAMPFAALPGNRSADAFRALVTSAGRLLRGAY
jgi:hypothetical protein